MGVEGMALVVIGAGGVFAFFVGDKTSIESSSRE